MCDESKIATIEIESRLRPFAKDRTLEWGHQSCWRSRNCCERFESRYAPHRHVARDLLVTADAERPNRVACCMASMAVETRNASTKSRRDDISVNLVSSDEKKHQQVLS